MASNLFNINVNDPLNGNVSNIANQDWYTADGTTTSPVSAYQYDAYNLLFSTELSGWEVNSAQNPYQLDLTVSDVNGDPTIGIGIDLHTNSGALTSYFNVPAGAEHNALAAQYASPAAYNAGLANGGGRRVLPLLRLSLRPHSNTTSKSKKPRSIACFMRRIRIPPVQHPWSDQPPVLRC